VLKNPEGRLDAALVQAYAYLLGPVPIGSLVRLQGRAAPGMVCGHWRDRAGRRQPWILDPTPERRSYKALLTDAAQGDQHLPRVEAVALEPLSDPSLLLSLPPART
jgi:hypothetical protein